MRSRLPSLLGLLATALLACSGPSKGKTVPPDEGGGLGSGLGSATVDAVNDPEIPLWSRVRKGTLPNGLTYYILPHARPENRASLWLAVNAGSIQEDEDQRGLAHFVEHMAFNGTAKFEKMAIVDYLEKIGMQFGPDVNAYTSFDETVYQLQVPTDDAAYLGTGLDILREWAGEISFDKAEVDKERGVVLEEWRLGQGAWSRVFDKQAPVLFAGSRYAERLPIGKPEILRKADRDTLVRFYDDWYRPELMAVIVVGDIDPDTIQKEIEARFSDLQGPEKPRERVFGGVPKADGTRVTIETDDEMPSTSVSIYNTFAHRRESHESDYRRFLVDNLYHWMFNQRLAEIGQRPDAPFVYAYSSTSDLTREAEAFSRGAGVKDGQVEATLELLMTEVLRVERHGFTPGELERGKKQLLRNSRQAAREIDKHDGAELADEITRNFFQGELMPGREGEAALTARFLPGVTLEELDALAKTWGGDENRVIEISGPTTLKAPSEARVRELITKVGERTLEPWVDEVGGTVLMAKPPTAGTVTAEVTLEEGVTEWTLSNGARVVIKPTDFENDTVLFSAFSPGGTAQASDKLFPSARFASEVVGAGGLGELSATALDKALTGSVVSAYAWIGEIQEGLSGNASVEDLETLLQLAHLRMTAPRRDEQAFAVWKQGTLEWVRNRRLIPEASFYEDMFAVISKNHPRRKPPEVADVEKVDLDQAMAFYQDRFGDAGDFTFVFVGNLDAAKLKPLVETYLASLPATGRKEVEKDIGIKTPKGVVKKEIKRGKEPKSNVFLTFHGDEKWSRDAERDIGILAEVLRIRLRETLREDMGGVYGVGVWGTISRRPRQQRAFTVQFGCAPENVDKLEKAVFAEIAKLQKDGIGDSYLEKVREGRKRGFEVAQKENWSWSSWLSTSYRFGDELKDVLDLEPTLARITSKNVQAAAKKYLAKKQYVLGVLMPEKAAKPAAAAKPAKEQADKGDDPAKAEKKGAKSE